MKVSVHFVTNTQIQYVSKINKQNFDLKLEVFHRRQKNEALEAKVEKLDVLEHDNGVLDHDNKELRDINDDLIRELEKRDAAVEEAVSLICKHEARIEELEQLVADLRQSKSTPELDSESFNDSCEPSEQPLSRMASTSPSTPPTARMVDYQRDYQAAGSSVDKSAISAEKQPWRTPSFLKENKKNTQTLRSLYSSDGCSTPGNPSVFSLPRPGSLFIADEQKLEADPDGFMLNSPRLSMLSESSFLSVYGKAKGSDLISAKKKEPRLHDESSSEDERPVQDSRQHNPSIHKWINESKTTSPKRRLAKDRRDDAFSSIDEVVDDLPTGTQPVQRARQALPRSPSRQKREESVNFQPLPPTGGTMFGHDVLPPTPDTMSTSNIEAHSAAPSIITEKSLMDVMPFGANNFRALPPEDRPQTAESRGDPSKLDPSPIFNEEETVMKSDGEYDSTQVAQSDAGTIGNPQVPHQASKFMSGSLKTKRQFGAVPVRPLLTTYATDMMFNGEGYDSLQPVRTMSYPSAGEEKRRRSVQFPPAGHEASEIPKTVNESHSTKSRGRGKNTIVTPTRESLGASPTESLSEGRGGESWTPSDTENSDRRQSSSLRFRHLFGKLTSPSAKSGAALAESPLAKSQSHTPPSTSHHRRPSSVHLQNSSKPLPEPPATRIARPSSARDPNHSQFGTARRYSLIPDANIVLGAQGMNSSKAEPAKDSVELARGVDLPYGKTSAGGVVHQRTDSDSRQSNRIMDGDEAVGAAVRKWGMGRSASAKMKEGLSGLRNRQK